MRETIIRVSEPTDAAVPHRCIGELCAQKETWHRNVVPKAGCYCTICYRHELGLPPINTGPLRWDFDFQNRMLK